MRLQSSHPHADRGLDAYFTPPEAVHALLGIEGQHLPRRVWEPACGDGAIVRPLRQAGYDVFASDIADYGLEDAESGVDYLQTRYRHAQAVITNPPYRLAEAFARKAIGEVGYVALLLRTNWLESTSRLPFFRASPPSRVWISSRRLPMMHRHGWEGPRASSNTAYSWIVWDAFAEKGTRLDWFDWREHMPAETRAAA